MSVITGDAQAMVRDLEDKEVVELCMNVLRELYKEQVSWPGEVSDMDKTYYPQKGFFSEIYFWELWYV